MELLVLLLLLIFSPEFNGIELGVTSKQIKVHPLLLLSLTQSQQQKITCASKTSEFLSNSIRFNELFHICTRMYSKLTFHTAEHIFLVFISSKKRKKERKQNKLALLIYLFQTVHNNTEQKSLIDTLKMFAGRIFVCVCLYVLSCCRPIKNR